jgi:NTP pyrophosphatase (non-canonical NTP hydrolase)
LVNWLIGWVVGDEETSECINCPLGILICMSDDLHSMQQQVHLFCQAHDLLASPEYRMIDLQSEIGEVGKEILKSTEYGRTDFSKSDGLDEELGDALFSLLCLANATECDLQTALKSVLAKYERRLRKGGAGSEHA